MRLEEDIYYIVYILTNEDRSLLAVGITGSLADRLYDIEREAMNLPLQKTKCTSLVYLEQFTDVEIDINREQRIKSYSKNKKKQLINSFNPEWTSLNKEIYEQTFLIKR